MADITERKYSEFYKKEMSLFGAFPRSDSLRFEVRVPRSFGTYYAEMQIYADSLDFPEDELKYIPFEWSGIENGKDSNGIFNSHSLDAFYQSLLFHGKERERQENNCRECGEYAKSSAC